MQREMVKFPQNKSEMTEEWFAELKKSEIKERDWLELKEDASESIGKSITAFLNKESGGLILCGIRDPKKGFSIEGIGDPQKFIEEKVSNYIKDISDPPTNEISIEVLESDSKKIVAIFIKSGEKFPYFYKGVVYFRAGSSTYPIHDKRQIMALLSYELNLGKALRIFRNELKLLKKEATGVKQSIQSFKTNSGYSSAIAFSYLPQKPDDSRIRGLFLVLEPFLLEKNILDDYHDILKFVALINIKLSILYSNLESYRSYLDFSQYPEQLVQKIEAIQKAIETK